jgi:predicted secreted hydrolase
MTRALFLILLMMPSMLAEYRLALPGYRYQFPQDHFSHPEFQTEWWYWTGNLFDEQGRRFGFELTFFRHNVRPIVPTGVWDIDHLYLAHLALTDVQGKKFFHTERVNRQGPGLAGISAEKRLMWNGNWRVQWSDAAQTLSAIAPELQLSLDLKPAKGPVSHGVDGVSQKAPGKGKASHYISFSRLMADGSIRWQGQTFRVKGTAWMDHEFFTNQLSDQQAGWDWFAIQLNNGEELMLYRLRKKDSSGDISSSGTFIDRQGVARHLSSSEFSLKPGACWQSSQSKGCYPLRWQIDVPSLALKLEASPALESQELASKKGTSPTYWEGAMDYRGSREGKSLSGVGYLEMTGYAQAFSFVQSR